MMLADSFFYISSRVILPDTYFCKKLVKNEILIIKMQTINL